MVKNASQLEIAAGLNTKGGPRMNRESSAAVRMSSCLVALPRGRMHLVTSGPRTGHPVILLHGWPGYWFDYRRVIPLVSPQVRVVAPDFLGFGHSDIPSGDPVNAADQQVFAGDVLDLMDRLEIEQAVVVGHDIGSAVAPSLARIAPTRVRGLVLLNPTHPHIGAKRYTPAAQHESWYQHFHLLPLAETLIDGDEARVAAYLGHFYRHWAGEKVITDTELRAVVEMYSRPGAFGASIAWYRARAARRARAANIDEAPVGLPVIALWGDRDPMRPLDHKDGFELTFPAAVSKVLPGVGHFVPAEAPKAVADAIAALA